MRNFWDYSHFLYSTSCGCFWNILFTCPYSEVQIKSNFRTPSRKSFYKPFKTFHKVISENKIKKTSNNNQIFSFFETYCHCMSIFRYFKLWMQACMLFLNAIVKMCSSISCLLLLCGDVELNPLPKQNTGKKNYFCHWNLNSIAARNFRSWSFL